MNSYDFLEVFIILQGLKRWLLNKEELIQFTKIENEEEFYKRIKTMFNINKELNTSRDVDNYFKYLINEYMKKIKPFIKINLDQFNIDSLLSYKEKMQNIDNVFKAFNSIHKNLLLLKKSKWKGRELFFEWYDFLLVLFIIRLKERYGYKKISFQKRKLETNIVDYKKLLDIIFDTGDISELKPMLPKYKSAFDTVEVDRVFEAGKVIFYSYLIKMEYTFDYENILSRIFSTLLLFIRQSELILSSLNCLQLGIERKTLRNAII
jgi:hypothetical protein